MDRDELLKLYYLMVLSRRFEEECEELYKLGEIGGYLHLGIGQEAIPVGTISVSEKGDHVVATYREHIHAIVKGIPPKVVMAELLGKRCGCSKGLGGSMHLFSKELNFWGGYGIVAQGLPVAVGIGYALKYKGLGEVVLCFFGDGATNNGSFYESLNLAKVFNLPIVFICENNQYAIGTHYRDVSAVEEIYKRACAHNIPSERVDGMDILKVVERTKFALEWAREGRGPYFLEFLTYRYKGHSMADPYKYKSEAEFELWKRRDPIKRFEKFLEEKNFLDESLKEQIKAKAEREVKEAVEFARSCQELSFEEMESLIYSEKVELS